MKAKHLAVGSLIAAGAGMMIFAGCGGGGGGGSSSQPKTLVINETTVGDAVADVAVAVPGCSDTLGRGRANTARAVKSGKALLGALGAIRLFSIVDPGSYSGNCTVNSAGSYSVVWADHESGVTTYDVTFSDYCSKNSATGDETVYDGGMTYVTVGTPSDAGPVINKQKADTTGDGVVVTTFDDTGSQTSSSTVVVDNYVRERGNPAPWEPLPPTIDNPDTETAGLLQVTDNTTGEVSKATGLKVVSYNETAEGKHFANIKSGYVDTPQGSFTVATEENNPLVIKDVSDVVDGAVIISGANGDTATVKVDPLVPNTVSVDINGTPIDGGNNLLDCSSVSFQDFFANM